MRAFAQPNGRIDLIIQKNTTPGNKNEPCPFPGSYAPATIRYIFAYILRPGAHCHVWVVSLGAGTAVTWQYLAGACGSHKQWKCPRWLCRVRDVLC
jgi:hypothetical protein